MDVDVTFSCNDRPIDPNFVCELCGIECETSDEFELHKVTHMGGIKCDICNIKPKDNSDLMKHILENHVNNNDDLVVSNPNLNGDNNRVTDSHTEIEKRSI